MRAKTGCLMIAMLYGAGALSAQTAVTTSGGTTGSLPVFTGPATVGSSVLTQASGNIGVGTTTPASLFSVGGGSPFQVTSTGQLNTTSGISVVNYQANTQLAAPGIQSVLVFQPNLTSNTNLNGFASSNLFKIQQTGTGTNSSQYLGALNNHYYQPSGTGSQSIAYVERNIFEIGGGSTSYGNVYLNESYGNLYTNSSNITSLTLFHGFMSWNGGGYTGTLTNLYGLYLEPMTGATNNYAIYSAGGNSYFAGSIGIGTASPGAKLEVTGNVKLTAGSGASVTFQDGSVQTVAWNGVLGGGDYAESVDVTGGREQYEPGDVMVIDPSSKGRFMKSARPYETSVMGIYSTRPGVVGRRQKTDKSHMKDEVPMAMVGVVPTKVTVEGGAIKPGDLLVTSSKPGYAMKGTDRTLLIGAIIGKALEPLDVGTGTIEVAVSIQ